MTNENDYRIIIFSLMSFLVMLLIYQQHKNEEYFNEAPVLEAPQGYTTQETEIPYYEKFADKYYIYPDEKKDIYPPIEDTSEYSDYPNYLDVLLNGNYICRWDKTELSFYLHKKVGEHIDPDVVYDVFTAWEKATGIFSFYEVDSSEEADIEVYLKLDLKSDRVSDAAGLAGPDRYKVGNTYTINGKHYSEAIITHAKVQLDARDLLINKYRFDMEYSVLTHEIGHTLGILGKTSSHSPSKNDCMYAEAIPEQEKACRLLIADGNTLKMLYGYPEYLVDPDPSDLPD